ncbi:MAG: molecular chaperone TorD family protein [Hyphomicrobiales bacterium]
MRERSLTYRAFAEGFARHDGAASLLDESIIPAPPDDNGRAFTEAFDTSISAEACSLHESDHTSHEQTSLFEELVRWHKHFGLRRTDTALLPDHVSAELEFMHFLSFQEEANTDDIKAALALKRAQRDFLARHLLVLGEAIAEKCPPTAKRYKALTLALRDFLSADLEYLNAATADGST